MKGKTKTKPRRAGKAAKPAAPTPAKAPVKRRRRPVPNRRDPKSVKPTDLGEIKATGTHGMAASISAAAGLVGLPKRVLTEAKAAGCPAFTGAGRVDCDLLLEWIADHPELSEAALNRSVEEALKIRADRKIREHRLAVLRREVIPVDEVRQTFTRSVIEAKTRLLGTRAGCAAKIAAATGGDVVKVESLLADRDHDFLDAMHRCEWNGGKA